MQCQWNGKPQRIQLWQTLAGKSPTKAIVVRYLHAAPEWDINAQEVLTLSQRIMTTTMNESTAKAVLPILHIFCLWNVDRVVYKTKDKWPISIDHLEAMEREKTNQRHPESTVHPCFVFRTQPINDSAVQCYSIGPSIKHLNIGLKWPEFGDLSTHAYFIGNE